MKFLGLIRQWFSSFDGSFRVRVVPRLLLYEIFFPMVSLQVVSQQLDQAQQSLSSASGEEDKAKAQIAVESLDALSKALGN